MLTPAQLVDIRRWMGYSVTGNATTAPGRELVYSDVTYVGLSLDFRLANLSPEEESVITNTFLPNLSAREQDIQNAADNLDTESAAVWKRNPQEIAERKALFTSLRRDLCAFLGFPAGKALQAATRVQRF